MKKIFTKLLLFKKLLGIFFSRIINKIMFKNFAIKNFSKWFFLGLGIALIIVFLDLLTKKIIFNLIDNYQLKHDYLEIKILSFFFAS